MLTQVEIGATMNTFHLFETEREIKVNIYGCIGVVGEFHMVMVAVAIFICSQCQVPFQALFFPVYIPLKFGAGFAEKLHFHLLELFHAHDELTGHNLVAECLSCLGDSKGDFGTT